MTNILILGGTGRTGRLIAGHLLDQTDVEITLASRHPQQASALADDLNGRFPGGRVKAVFADAGNINSLYSAFEGHQLVVVASPTTAQAGSVICSAIEAKIDYLDVQLSAGKLALLNSLKDEIEQAGLCFITEAGFHPGLPSALVRYAASQMDSIESAVVAGYLNMGRDLPYTDAVDELIEVFKEYQAQVFKDGKWTSAGSFERRKIDFGSDIGLKTCYSMFFEEMRHLPEMYPSLKETGFYMSEIHWVVDWVIMMITWAGIRLFPKSVRPLGKFLWWGMRTFHKPPYRVELQVQGHGIKNGQPIDVQTIVAHPDGYELTAIPVAGTLMQYLDGSARRPGLWMMGHLAEPARLLQDMQKMGVRVTPAV